MVDGPAIARTQMNFKSMHLTKLKVPVARGARHGTVLKAWRKARIDKKWKETSWYKRLEASQTVILNYLVGKPRSKRDVHVDYLC